MIDATSYAASFHRNGYFIHDKVISDSEVDELRQAIAEIPNRDEARRKRNVYGVRNLLEICPAVRRWRDRLIFASSSSPFLVTMRLPCERFFLTRSRAPIGRCSGIRTMSSRWRGASNGPATLAGRERQTFGKCSRPPKCLPIWWRCEFTSMIVLRTMVRSA